MRAGLLTVGVVLAASLSHAACARNKLVVELSGSVMYEKPRIEQVSHTLSDTRSEAGVVSVKIVMQGDPGLKASFDISPGIADRQPMTESPAGHYVAEFVFPGDIEGGPFTIFGRVWHDKAGEVVLRDPQPITITIIEPGS